MTAPLRRLVLSVALLLPALSFAHPSIAEIATTWTGLERAGGTPGTRVFTLVLQAADSPTPPSSTPESRAANLPLSARPGQKLTGTWTARLAARDRQGRSPAPVLQTVEAEYFPDVGLLRVTRRPERGGAGFDCLVVFDADVTRLAGGYTGGMKDVTPFYATRGATLPAELVSVTGLPADQFGTDAARPAASSTSAADFARALNEANAAGDYTRAMTLVNERRRSASPSNSTTSSASASGSPSPSSSPVPAPPRDFPAEIAALAQQTQEAARAKDTPRIRELQEQMRQLRTEMAAQRRRPGAAAAPSPASPAVPTSASPAGAASRCPEHIVAWTAQLDAFGGAVEHFEGNIPASNLFRPRVFTPHFGKTFAALSPAERAAIASDLQRNCLLDGSRLGRGSLINALLGVFQNTPGFDAAEAGLGGLALELIADWNLRSVQDLDAETDPARVADFETKSAQLVAHLWPRERDDARAQLAALKSRNHGRRFLAEVDGLGRAAAIGNLDALQRLVNLLAYADAAKISAADRAALQQKQTTVLAASAASFFSRARADVLATPIGLDHLLRGKAWLAAHGEALQALHGRPEADAFDRDFRAGRAASYIAEQAHLAREVAALDGLDRARMFGLSFAVYFDAEASSVWKDLDAQRHAKIRELERREFLARTGGGPFGPDFPGARYLNALWRNDQKQVEEMDRQWREPFLAQLTLLDQVDYTPGLVEKITGGARSADQTRRLRRALLEEASLASGLLVAFAYGFEEAYPQCMEPDAKEIRILVHHERSVRNLLGLEIGRRPDGTSTITHRVNRRHVPAVEDLRIADPNDRIVTEALLGRPGSPVSQLQVGLGLGRAMRENTCNSEIIRRLETALIARWETFAERKRAIKRRILGDAR